MQTKQTQLENKKDFSFQYLKNIVLVISLLSKSKRHEIEKKRNEGFYQRQNR